MLAYGGSRTLLQAAYSVQQFDAETIGYKFSQGNRRHLLDAPASAPSTGVYGSAILPGKMGTALHNTTCIRPNFSVLILPSITAARPVHEARHGLPNEEIGSD